MEILYKAENFEELQKDKYLFQFIQNKTLTKIKHRHDFYEIVLVLQGNVTHVIDGRPIKMMQNSFLILSPSHSHFFQTQSNDVKLISLSVIREKFMEIKAATEITPVFAEPFPFDDNINILINQLILYTSLTRTQSMNQFLISLFFSFLNTPKAQTSTLTDLKESLQAMSDKENLKTGVQRWCELAGYSRAHLARLAKKYYDDTPEHIIRKLKMQIAEKYLKRTTLPIEEIADLSGFESISAFYVVFKKSFGITPNQFRNKFKHISALIQE